MVHHEKNQPIRPNSLLLSTGSVLSISTLQTDVPLEISNILYARVIAKELKRRVAKLVPFVIKGSGMGKK